jgi:hypothetical protein
MIGRYIKPILLVTGIATASMIAALFAPSMVLGQLVVEPPTDAVSLAVTQHWGVLVFFLGALLVCAAYRREVRQPVLIVTIIEKIVLAAGLLFLPMSLRRPMPRSLCSIFCIWPGSRDDAHENPDRWRSRC